MGAEFATPRRRALANSGTFTVSGTPTLRPLHIGSEQRTAILPRRHQRQRQRPCATLASSTQSLGRHGARPTGKAATIFCTAVGFQALLLRSTPACLAVMTVRPSPLIGHTAPIRRRLITHPYTPPGSAGRGFERTQ